MDMLLSINRLLSKYVTALILILSVCAYFEPNYFAWAIAYTPFLLGVAMFGMGLTIQVKDIDCLIKRPRDIAIGVIAQYTIMPLGAWALCHIFQLSPEMAIGIILVGCCPGGTASNVITYIARGDVALSVGMTIVSTLLAPLVTPLLIFGLAGAWVDVALLPMMMTVVKVIILPIGLGVLAQWGAGQRIEPVRQISPMLSIIAIVLLIAAIIATNRHNIVLSGLLTLGLVCLHNLLGLVMGLVIGRVCGLSYDKTTALAIEVGMQNSGLAVALATANFAINPLATLAGALFSVWHNLSGAVFATFRRHHLAQHVPKRIVEADI